MWSACSAEDGAKGLAAFEPARFDVVLLDLNMPGLPGARVLEELRRRAPRQLVVVMSGAVHDPAELALADAVLQKPAGRATIVETIARILGRTGR